MEPVRADNETMTDELEASPRNTGSVLGAIEYRLLIRLAKAMPGKVTPDQLTVLGLAGAAIACAGYALCNWNTAFLWLASAGIALNWFGDSLDGTLARVRHKERQRYGFMVDHTVDLAAQLLIGLGLGFSPFVHLDVACIGLIVYLAFAVFAFIKSAVSGELQISYSGIGPTEVRCALIAINVVLVWYLPAPVVVLWEPLNPIDVTVLAVATLGALVLIGTALREIANVAREEE